MSPTPSGRPPDAAPDPDAPVPAWIEAALDEAVVRCDHAGRVVSTHGPAELLPAPPSALIGRRVADVDTLPAPLRDAWQNALDRCLDTQRAQIAAYAQDRGDGQRVFEARMLPTSGFAVVAIRDVGERDGLRQRLEWLATHDGVTGLANVRALRERLAIWMRAGSATSTPVALLVVDLDRFKQSNDLHGRSIGDSLLRLTAQRMLREAVAELAGRPPDRDDGLASLAMDDAEHLPNLVVARLGGDQFAIGWRIDGRDDPVRAASDLATRLIGALGVPTRIVGQTLFVRASIGVALYPGDALDPSTLLAQAEGALKRAKQAGRNQFRRHGDASARDAAQPPGDETALRAALAAGQFLLVYQPKFELASSLASQVLAGDAAGRRPSPTQGALIAVEALVRWRTPTGALLAPRDFVPLAETSGMIRPLGEWVLRTALAEAARFADEGGARVGVAVNVSLLQLHDRAFVETVADALADHGFAPNELTLELAETAFVDDVRLVGDVVAELSALGVRLAIDHFGVGTAGFVALKALPIDEIKIDRSFIAGAAIDAFDATIVAGLIGMAHDLGKTVTADGVERVDQIAALNQMRCDAIQGFFVGEPMTADDLLAARSLWRQARGDRRGDASD